MKGYFHAKRLLHSDSAFSFPANIPLRYQSPFRAFSSLTFFLFSLFSSSSPLRKLLNTCTLSFSDVNKYSSFLCDGVLSPALSPPSFLFATSSSSRSSYIVIETVGSNSSAFLGSMGIHTRPVLG